MEMASSAADSSTNTLSRAVEIPHRSDVEAYSSNARQRSARHGTLPDLSNQSDTGASSLSSENSSPASRLLPSIVRKRSTDGISRAHFHNGSPEGSLPTFSPTLPPFPEDTVSPQTRCLKLKGKAVDDPHPPDVMPSANLTQGSPLGPSMLSSQIYKSINLNARDPDEPPRLITFTKAGQGFNWNEELFLPSYMVSRYSRGRRKQYDGDLGEDDVEVAEIFVTDEEANNMMP
jgi:hypothetical protein